MASYIIHILLTFLSLRLRLVFGQDYTYLGCFYDNNRREALPDLIYCDRSKLPYQTCQNVCGPTAQYCQSQQMTVELCRDICADQNMKYFGLQAGSQCLCGGFFAPYDVLGQPTGQNNTCNIQCTGDSSQMCGADFQISAYQINDPASASDCFNPGYVLNGDQSQQDSSLYNSGDVIDFTAVCQPPSIKDGAASITCTASGNWTDPTPTCTVRCATPTAPMYATFSSGQALNDSYEVDDEVLFDCDNDPMKTNQVLTCNYYGDWEPTVTDCPEPTPTQPTTTQPTTTPQPTATLPSTTSSTTPITGGGDSGSTTTPTVVTEIQLNSTTTPTNDSVTTETSTGSTSGGPTTPVPSTVTMSAMPSTVSNTTPSQSTGIMASMSSSSSGAPSSSPSSSTSSDANTSGPTDTMTSSPGGQATSAPAVTGGGEKTTAESDRSQGNDMDLLPIIIGAAAGVLVVILFIIIVSVCCSRGKAAKEKKKRKQKSKKIPFNPALGAASFGNPAFEEDEAEQSRRGFVQENEYGDRQTYDVGVSDYAMVVDENNRDPPDGKDSPGAKADGTEDATYAVVNKNRQDSEEP